MGYRYIGAKNKIIEEILNKINIILPKGGHVVDLMCGTAAVSEALRKNGYIVTAIDVMTYSYHHAVVALLFDEYPSFKGAKEFIEKFSDNVQMSLFPESPYEKTIHSLNSVPPEEGYFFREFSIGGNPINGERPRNYYTPENAMKIDAVRRWIRYLKSKGMINDLEHSLLLHDLIMAANDVANIAGTYGHYLSKTVQRAKDNIKLSTTNICLNSNHGKHKVLKGYAEDLAPTITCDLCYIDPPYMKRQYAANYHILETLAREDEPEAIGVSGLRPWRDQYSNFCTKTKIHESFRKVFEMQCDNFLMSYSEDGLLKIEQIEELFKEYGDVEITTFHNKRFRSNNSSLAPTLIEYLVYLKR